MFRTMEPVQDDEPLIKARGAVSNPRRPIFLSTVLLCCCSIVVTLGGLVFFAWAAYNTIHIGGFDVGWTTFVPAIAAGGSSLEVVAASLESGVNARTGALASGLIVLSMGSVVWGYASLGFPVTFNGTDVVPLSQTIIAPKWYLPMTAWGFAHVVLLMLVVIVIIQSWKYSRDHADFDITRDTTLVYPSGASTIAMQVVSFGVVVASWIFEGKAAKNTALNDFYDVGLFCFPAAFLVGLAGLFYTFRAPTKARLIVLSLIIVNGVLSMGWAYAYAFKKTYGHLPKEKMAYWIIALIAWELVFVLMTFIAISIRTKYMRTAL